jgi:dTMP kinase
VAQLIAIEGIDGSGKGTQAARLRDRLNDSGVKTALISFPRYEATSFGRAVGQFLNGRFGALDEVSPFLVSLLYAGDRFESRQFLLDALSTNDVVVLDRYVASNMAHQGAKATGPKRRELIDWVCRVEYEIYALPHPDLNVLLDLPADRAQQLIAKKSARTYTDKPADLQEADGSYLARVRETYHEIAATEPNWQRIDCTAGERIRKIEEIGEELWNVVQTVSGK